MSNAVIGPSKVVRQICKRRDRVCRLSVYQSTGQDREKLTFGSVFCQSFEPPGTTGESRSGSSTTRTPSLHLSGWTLYTSTTITFPMEFQPTFLAIASHTARSNQVWSFHGQYREAFHGPQDDPDRSPPPCQLFASRPADQCISLLFILRSDQCIRINFFSFPRASAFGEEAQSSCPPIFNPLRRSTC